MRTKTLLMAGAALALSFAISKADPIYSANIVGYTTVNMVVGYNMVENTLLSGGGDTADIIMPTLPDGSTMLRWVTNGGGSFIYNVYDTLGGATTPATSWYMSDASTSTNPPTINPGTGFFLQLPAVFTNVFVGAVIPNVGATNVLSLTNGYNLVGSTMPVSGPISNAVFNFTPPDGTTMLTWNGSGYTYNVYDTLGGATDPGVSWYMSDASTSTNPPTLKIGQSFFLQLPSAWDWKETLNP